MSSRRLTSITLTTGNARDLEFAENDRVSKADMVRKIKAKALLVKAQCDHVLNANEDDFLVETYTGLFIRRNVEIVK